MTRLPRYCSHVYVIFNVYFFGYCPYNCHIKFFGALNGSVEWGEIPRESVTVIPFGISQIHAGKLRSCRNRDAVSCIRLYFLQAEFLAEAQNERRIIMKKTKILIALLVLSLLFVSVFAGCGKKEEAEEGPVCSITVTAADVLEHMDELSEEKQTLIPEDGIIYKNESVSFKEGATLYDVLTDALKSENIHFDAPGGTYFSAFGNLYDSDFTYGGWLYSVNGEDATVGASEFVLSDGDVVEFFYVCDYNVYFGFDAA